MKTPILIAASLLVVGSASADEASLDLPSPRALAVHRVELRPVVGWAFVPQSATGAFAGAEAAYRVGERFALGADGVTYAPFAPGAGSNPTYPTNTTDWAANLDFTVFPLVARRGPGDEAGSLEAYVVGGVGVVAARPVPVVDPAHRWFDDSYMVELAPGLGLRVFVARSFALTFEARDRMYLQKVESPAIETGRFGPSDPTTWYDRATPFTNAFELRIGASFFAGP
jgi:hypothetical protein